MGGLCQMRQDWDRISRGLADVAIARGWWPSDGSKLDFAEAVSRPHPGDAAALRRWGRSTLELEQQNGRIELAFVRRLLSELAPDPSGRDLADAPRHGLCLLPSEPGASGTAASLVVRLGPTAEDLPLAWCAFGPPYLGVYFPVSLAGELPAAFSDPGPRGVGQRHRRLQNLALEDLRHEHATRSALASLQTQLDRCARDFAADAASLRKGGDGAALDRLAGSFMQMALERFEETLEGIHGHERQARPAAVSL